MVWVAPRQTLIDLRACGVVQRLVAGLRAEVMQSDRSIA